MGNKSSSKNNKGLDSKDKDDDDTEGFFLEDWEILTDISKLKEFSSKKKINNISLNNELLISQVNTDPFKDYEEIKSIGSGSFAKVLLVRNKITGKTRAMKIIKKKNLLSNSSQGSTDLEILNEINILKQIDHPNVIKYYQQLNIVTK